MTKRVTESLQNTHQNNARIECIVSTLLFSARLAPIRSQRMSTQTGSHAAPRISPYIATRCECKVVAKTAERVLCYKPLEIL